MTEIAFHFNAPDKLAYACRLLRKACAKGTRTAVTGSPELLEALDQALWTFSPLDFVAHCRSDAPAGMLAASPVVLVPSLASAPVLPTAVNLGAGVPPGFERFERLVEVVGMDDDDRLNARQRWKHYAERGYTIVRHDLAAPAAA